MGGEAWGKLHLLDTPALKKFIAIYRALRSPQAITRLPKRKTPRLRTGLSC